MIHKKQISNIAKNILKHEKGIRNIEQMHPHREWLIGLILALAIFSLSATWGVINYFSNRDLSSDIDSGPGPGQVLYREEQVLEALKKIADRESNFNALSQSTPEIFETSIPTSTTTEEVTQDMVELETEIVEDNSIPTPDLESPALDVN